MSTPVRTDWTTVILMALGFGLVGIDRFMISTLYPVIAKDLGLDYADIGIITGALAFAWGFAALFMGSMADRIGRRRVLTGALLAFSLLIGLSGLATGLLTLVLVRVVMGFADGAYTPASIASTIENATPRHHGLAIGIQQMMLPAIGLGLAPLLIAGLLHVVDWRWTFVCFAVPGLILTWAAWRRLPDPQAGVAKPLGSLAGWRAVLKYRNVVIAMGMMLSWLTCLITTSAFMPSYLLDHFKLDFGTMSAIMSAIGIGAAAGTLTLAWLSDRLGRKPVMFLSALGTLAALVMLSVVGAQPAILFVLLFAVHFFNNAAITLTVGPICAETVPPALMATASGVVIATGELFGGGLAPVFAGYIAASFGIAHLLWLPIGAIAVSLLLVSGLSETRPRTAHTGKEAIL